MVLYFKKGLFCIVVLSGISYIATDIFESAIS